MHKKAYVCLKVGTKYSAEYVYKLHSMVNRWDSCSPVPFYCYTDTPEDFVGTNIIPIPIIEIDRYERWWFKLPLLVEPALSQYHKKILFDLDVIIHGPLDFTDHISAEKLTVCKALWKSETVLDDKTEKNTLFNSSVMMWENADYVYDYFQENEDMFMVKYKGVDRFLHHEQINVDTFPAGLIYSYRKGASLTDNQPFVFRNNYSIALFHQHPKQHELASHHIVSEYWK